jgi:hypothetical protein
MENQNGANAYFSVFDRKSFRKLLEEWSILFGHAGNLRSLGAAFEIGPKIGQGPLIADGVGFYVAIAQILGVAPYAKAFGRTHCEITKADALYHATDQIASGLELFAIVRHAQCNHRAANG